MAASRSCWSKLAITIAIVAIFFGVFTYLDSIKHNWYVFDQNKLNEIAVKNLARNLTREQLLEAIINDLAAEYVLVIAITFNLIRYPGHINVEQEWMLNVAGGAMGTFAKYSTTFLIYQGAMTILHSSVTEYIIFFGTPIGTEGFTGRFLADDYFTILEGEQWAFPPGSLDREVYRPGDMHHLPRGAGKGYRMPDRCWALEYARGWIPAMFPFGFADGIFSTLDFHSLWQIVKVSVPLMTKELLQGKI